MSREKLAKMPIKTYVSVAMALAVILSVIISSVISHVGDKKSMKQVLQKTGYLEDVQTTLEDKLGETTEMFLKENNIVSFKDMTEEQRRELTDYILKSITEEYGDLDEDEEALLTAAIEGSIIDNIIKDKADNAAKDSISSRGLKTGDSVDSKTIETIINEVTEKVIGQMDGTDALSENVREIASDVVNEYINNNSITQRVYSEDKATNEAIISSIKADVMESMQDIETLRGAYDALLQSSESYQKSAESEMESLYKKIEDFQSAQKDTDDAQDENTKKLYNDMMTELTDMTTTFSSYQSEQEAIIDIINETLAKKADYGVTTEVSKELAESQIDAVRTALQSADSLISDIESIEDRLLNEEDEGFIKDLENALIPAQSLIAEISEKDVNNITEDDLAQLSDYITEVENAFSDVDSEINKLTAKEEAVANYINMAQSNVDALSASLVSNSEALTPEDISALNDEIAELNAKLSSIKSYSFELSDIRITLTDMQNVNTATRSNVNESISAGSSLDDLLDALDGIDRRLVALSKQGTETAKTLGSGEADIQSSKSKLTGSNQTISDASTTASGLAELQLSGNATIVDITTKLYGFIRNNEMKISYNSGLISDLQEEMAYVKAWEARIETLEDQVTMLASTYATSADLNDLKEQVEGQITDTINEMRESFQTYQGVTAEKLKEVVEIDKQLNRRIDAIKLMLDSIKTNLEELDKRDVYIGPFSVNSDDYTITDENINEFSDIMVDYDLSTLPPTAIGFSYTQGNGYLIIHGANGAYIKRIHIQNEVNLTEWDTTVPDYDITYEDSSSSIDNEDDSDIEDNADDNGSNDDSGEPNDSDDTSDPDNTGDTGTSGDSEGSENTDEGNEASGNDDSDPD